MSLPHARSRKTSDAGPNDKTTSDKKKHVSRSTGTKNETHGKTETQGQTNNRRRASIAEHSKAESKVGTKRRTSSDVNTKTTHAAGSTNANEKAKSHGTTATQGKTVAQGRSETHGKTGTQGTAKKSEVNKPRTNKKTEHDKSVPGKHNHTETEAVTTAVSQNSDNVFDQADDSDD